VAKSDEELGRPGDVLGGGKGGEKRGEARGFIGDTEAISDLNHAEGWRSRRARARKFWPEVEGSPDMWVLPVSGKGERKEKERGGRGCWGLSWLG
jgi:hypothetical protein